MKPILFTTGAVRVLDTICVSEELEGVHACSEPLKLDTSAKIAEAFAHLASKVKEEFWAVYLDSKNVPLGAVQVSVGILSASLVHPREVFAPGLRIGGVGGIILLHNHPSGDPEPSPEDYEVTRRLVEAGELLGIRVLDHVVIGRDNQYVSFLERGLI